MRVVDEKTEYTPKGPTEILSEIPSSDKKKKNIDEMIEEFNRDNPAKNSKKIYRGVF